jgi:hypothetical protein
MRAAQRKLAQNAILPFVFVAKYNTGHVVSAAAAR